LLITRNPAAGIEEMVFESVSVGRSCSFVDELPGEAAVKASIVAAESLPSQFYYFPDTGAKVPAIAAKLRRSITPVSNWLWSRGSL
jgi:hypothetical protein